eukprot:g37881.t1
MHIQLPVMALCSETGAGIQLLEGYRMMSCDSLAVTYLSGLKGHRRFIARLRRVFERASGCSPVIERPPAGIFSQFLLS